MATFPGYQRQVGPQQAGPSFTQARDVSSGLNSISRGLATMGAWARQEDEADEIAKVNAVLADQRLAMTERLQQEITSTTGTERAAGLAQRFDRQMESERDKLAGDFMTKKGRDALLNGMNSLRGQLGTSAIAGERDGRLAYRVGQHVTTLRSSAQFLGQNPLALPQVQADMDRAIDEFDESEVSAPKKMEMRHQAQRALGEAASLGYLEQGGAIQVQDFYDPIKRRKESNRAVIEGRTKDVKTVYAGGEQGFDRAMEVVARNEGGFVRAGVLGDNAGATNYGVTQDTLNRLNKAHPGKYPSDVKKLSKDQAQQIAKTEYYDRNDIAQYSPGVQIYALDTVYQHGRGPQLLKASGGDLDRLHDLRKDYLESVIATKQTQADAGDAEARKFVGLAPSLRRRLDRTYKEAKQAEESQAGVVEQIADQSEAAVRSDMKSAGFPSEIADAVAKMLPNERLAYLNRSFAMANEQRSAARATLQANHADNVARAAAGGDPMFMATPEDYDLAYRGEAPVVQQQHERDIQIAEYSNVALKAGASDRANFERRYKSQAAGGDADAHKTWTEVQQMNNAAQSKWNADPVGVAMATGKIETLRIGNGPEGAMDFGRDLATRAATMRNLKSEQGFTKGDVLSKEEAQSVTDYLFGQRSNTSDAVFALKGAMERDREGTGALIRQIGENDPGLRGIARLAASIGDQVVTERRGLFDRLGWTDPEEVSGIDVLDLAMTGYKISTAPKSDGTEPRKPAYDTDEAKLRFDNTYPPEAWRQINATTTVADQQSAFNMVEQTYIGLLAREGKVLAMTKDDLDKDVWNQAQRMVLGEPLKIDGVATMMPPGIDRTRAETILQAEVDRLKRVNGYGGTAFQLIPQGIGVYGLFAQNGSGIMRDDNNQPVTIDLGQINANAWQQELSDVSNTPLPEATGRSAGGVMADTIGAWLTDKDTGYGRSMIGEQWPHLRNRQ